METMDGFARTMVRFAHTMVILRNKACRFIRMRALMTQESGNRNVMRALDHVPDDQFRVVKLAQHFADVVIARRK